MLTKNSRSEEGLCAWRLEIKGHVCHTTSGIIDNDQQYDQGGYCPQLACQPKCRIRKNHVFITSETVFCIEIDSKNDITRILKRLIWGGGLLSQKQNS